MVEKTRRDAESFAGLRRILAEHGIEQDKHPKLFEYVDRLERAQNRVLESSSRAWRRRIRKLIVFFKTFRERSKIDELTGAIQKKEFENRLLPSFIRGVARERRDLDRQGEWAALWVIDVDRFKDINDNCGHLVGDQVLGMLGDTINATIRHGERIVAREWQEESNNIAARIGGDEFSVLQRFLKNFHEAYFPAERLKKSFGSKPWGAVGQYLQLHNPTLSIAIICVRLASLRGYKERAEEISIQWRELADTAMYEAKRRRSWNNVIKGFEYTDSGFRQVKLDDPLRVAPSLDEISTTDDE